MSTTFAAMVPEVSPFLPGCPSLTIELTMRKMAIELCTWAKVWRAEMTPITLVPGTSAYTPAPTVAYARYGGFVAGSTLVAGNKRELKPMTYEIARARFPSWLENYSGTAPQWAITKTPGQVLLAPVPDTAGTMSIYGVLIPTLTATEWDDTMYAEFQRVLFHGTLAELMAMPGRNWSDQKMAILHRRDWVALRARARTRVDHDYTTQSISVEAVPFA